MFSLLNNKTILVVDDDPANREVVISSLFELAPQTQALSAVNGEQALQILEVETVDLVLLDWEMPILNGYETLLRIKANPKYQRLPVVMYTGIMTDLESLQKSLEAGAADFLRKPTDPIEILARLRAILSQEYFLRQLLEAEKEKYALQISELSSTVLHLQQQESFLEQLKNSLQESLASLNPKENIQKLIRSIQQTDMNEGDWERYKTRMDAMQHGFLEKLSLRHPDLSRQQLTLCSLFRLGLVSKEAAQILSMSLEALDKNRYRIRKKLQLPPNASLENYLLQI
jgi:DNA-binding response OmpR family regulator